VTSVLLRSPVPIVMLWGEDGVMLYNDAYSAFAGGRHPRLLGSKVREGWPEIADFNDHVMRVGLAGGTLAYKDQELTLHRHGRPEQVFMNLDYSPVLDEAGKPAGVLAIVVETTTHVAAERELRQSEARLAFLDRLREETQSLTNPAEVMVVSARLLGEHLDATVCAYADMEPDQDAFTIRGDWTAPGAPSIVGPYRLAGFGETAVEELRSGRPLITRDTLAELGPEQAALFLRLGLRATVCMPLVKGGRLIALMAVHAAKPRDWTEPELALVAEVAERSWAHIERVRSEAALRESEARFRLAADAVPQIVWVTDAEGRMEFFNKGWADYVGSPELPVTAADVAAAAVHPDDAGMTMDAFNEARRTGSAFRVEHRVRSKSGAYRWFLVRADPYRDPTTGGVVRWYGASVDIHDRKMAEARLQALNADLERQVVERSRERGLIWQHSLDLLSVLDLRDATFDKVNPAWTATLGWATDEVEGRPYEDFIHPDDVGASTKALAQVRRGNPALHFINRYRTKDGGWRWLQWVAVPEGGKLYSVTRDVTAERERQAELEAAEAARREADALYRAYFENAPEALFLIGVEPDGGFVVEQVNPAHEAGVGFRLEDIRGRRIEEILPPDAAGRVLETYGHVVETGTTYQYREVFDLGRDPQHWDTSLVPVRDAAGRISRLIGSSRNVTRQVMAEEALRQAQKMEAVGQLTGGIAHDFNNLLGAVVGSLDLIRRKPGDVEKVRRFAEAGLQAAERGAKLTGQLLAFSRAQRLELKPVAVADLVQGMRDLLARTIGPMVRLTFVLDGDGVVLSDPTQLEMAVLNLAINARDAMAEGGELTIATAGRRMDRDAELAAGEYVELSVTDTGAGMPPEVAARAFDPFFTTKGVGKGTGLGLSQAYGMARQAGGTARIESRPGAGTTVRIYLPRTSEPMQSSDGADQPATTNVGNTATILIVDDDPDMRRVLVASLDTLGYRVLEAADGAAGLAVLGEEAPDLLILDFAMPGMNGAEVAKVARERRPDLPIVFVSGYADTAAIEAAAGTNMTVLRKPFRVDDLQSVLIEVLDGTNK
jgi:PAS domain S-box-containing protein